MEGTGFAAVLITLGLLVPAGATAAPAKPGVTTGPAANVGQSTATLTGRVNPNEVDDDVYVRVRHHARLRDAGPEPARERGQGQQRRRGHGRHRRARARHDLPLPPGREQRQGRDARRDRTLRTQRQPLGLTLGATPNPVSPGGRTLIAGTLSGKGNAERQIVLQSNPFPYTQGFQNASDVHLTNGDGTFSFPVLSVPLNTQYRVVLPNLPQVASPIVSVGVAPKVGLSTKRVRRTAHGAIFRFSGKVTPAHDGTQIAIQRLKGTTWVTISGTISKHRSSAFSRYRKSVRLRRGGTFRVFAGTNDGDHVESVSRSVKLRVAERPRAEKGQLAGHRDTVARHGHAQAAPLLMDVPAHDLDACWKVQRALDEQGIDYEVVKHGYGKGGRDDVVALSGQKKLPVIELDGEAYRAESDDMAARVRSGALRAA